MMIDALHRRTPALPVCTGIGGSSHVTMKLRLVHAPPTYSRMLWRTSPRGIVTFAKNSGFWRGPVPPWNSASH
jgi:hypothetical protein